MSGPTPTTPTRKHARKAPRAPGDLFVYWKDGAGGWRWRLKGRNGRVIDSSSESFTRKWSARRNAYLTTRRLEAWVGRTGNE